MNVQQIIHTCGGATKVAEATQQTANPVTFEAVFKWYRNGIPETHWPLVISLGGLTVQEVYDANRAAERVRLSKIHARRRHRKSPPERDQAAA